VALPGLLLLLSAGCKGAIAPVTLKTCAPGEALGKAQGCEAGKDLVLGSAKEVETADGGSSSDAGVPEADFARTADRIDGLTPDGGLLIGAAGAPSPGVLLDIRGGIFVQNQRPVWAQLGFIPLSGDRATGSEGGGQGEGANVFSMDVSRTQYLRLRLAGTVTSDGSPLNPATCGIELTRVSDAAVIGRASVQAYSIDGVGPVQRSFLIEALDIVDGGTAAYGFMLKNDSAADAGVRCFKNADAGAWTLNVEGF
jgi:hypothetical protein